MKAPVASGLEVPPISCLLHSIAAKHGMHGVTITALQVYMSQKSQALTHVSGMAFSKAN
jgi:hypothetical protein